MGAELQRMINMEGDDMDDTYDGEESVFNTLTSQVISGYNDMN